MATKPYNLMSDGDAEQYLRNDLAKRGWEPVVDRLGNSWRVRCVGCGRQLLNTQWTRLRKHEFHCPKSAKRHQKMEQTQEHGLHVEGGNVQS